MPAPSPSVPSLQRRAVYAVLLLVGFYALAIVMAVSLLALPLAEWQWLGRVDPRVALFGLASGVAIIAAVLPRVDRFVPPGPELLPPRDPELFRLIQEVATATGQAPPRHVYLLADLNAWVAERGGMMGSGGVRVMGVGLPLLQALSVPEFRGVLAHEFGHFHGGDTQLGPWIHKTRSAIGRTLEAFSRKHTWLARPFEWYGNFFLRITHGVSRQQEYAADALAARVAGAAPLAAGLRTIHALAPAFPAYWRSTVAPALSAGYRPPIAAGFQEFITAPDIAAHISTLFDAELSRETADPYDTHPPLAERLAALPVADAPFAEAGPPALSLLGDADVAERELLCHLFPKDEIEKFRPAQWEDLGPAVWLPRWALVVRENRERLAGLRFEELAALAVPPGALPVRLKLAASAEVATEKSIHECRLMVGALLAVILHARGYSFTAPVGVQPTFTVGTTPFRPFTLFDSIQDGSMSAAEWDALAGQAGIAGQELVSLAGPDAPGTVGS